MTAVSILLPLLLSALAIVLAVGSTGRSSGLVRPGRIGLHRLPLRHPGRSAAESRGRRLRDR